LLTVANIKGAMEIAPAELNKKYKSLTIAKLKKLQKTSISEVVTAIKPFVIFLKSFLIKEYFNHRYSRSNRINKT
jgi:hypothetical protein